MKILLIILILALIAPVTPNQIIFWFERHGHHAFFVMAFFIACAIIIVGKNER